MRTELGRLASETVIYGTGQVIMRLFSMLLIPIFTAYLTPADYGMSAKLGLIAFVITLIFGLGIGAVIGLFYYRSNELEHRAMVIWSAFGLLLISSTILMTAVIAFAPAMSVATFGTPRHGDLVIIAIAGVCCGLLSTPLAMYFQFEKRARSYVVLSTLATAIGLVSSFVLIVSLGRGVHGLVEGTTIAQAATLLLFVGPCARRLPPRVHGQMAREMVKVGIAFVPSFIWVFVIQHGNKYILERVNGFDALGIYTIGFNFGMVSAIAVSGFQAAWMPYFMSFVHRRDEGERVLGRTTTYYVFGFGLLTLLFFATARPAVLILTQPAFHAAYLVIGCAAASQFLTGLFSVLLPPIYFANQVQYVSVVQGVSAALSALINWLLIRWFGLIGAAVGLALSASLLPLLQHLWNIAHGAAYLRPQYEWPRIVRYLIFYGVFAALFMTRRAFSLTAEISLATTGCAVAMGSTLAFLSAAERRALWSTVRVESLSVVRRLRSHTAVG